MRGVIVAAPGRKLVVSDLSNIEGRKLAWLAGEQWKLDAFRDFDAGIGRDLYILAYARAFGIDPADVDDAMRQIGKVMELALGYEGGVGAFVTMSATYGLDLDDLARAAWPRIPREHQQNAVGMWKWANKMRRTLGLSEAVYTTCEALKAMWREAHPATKALWPAYQTAAINAVQNPGTEFPAGRCVFDRRDNWLRIRLPSGRFLCYPSPRVDEGKLSYMGVNVYCKKWHRIDTYGGKIAENIDQASSRDIMAYALPRIEAAGYPLVLTVHDEAMTEPPDSDEFNDKELSKLLATNPPWAAGLPLAAKGFTTHRLRKG
jgi:DNA polymerase